LIVLGAKHLPALARRSKSLKQDASPSRAAAGRMNPRGRDSAA
jgi:hypothetical protein